MNSLRLAFLCAVPVLAQDAFQANWSAERSKGPSEVEFVVTLPKTTFYIGEVIAASFQFSSSKAERFEVTVGSPSRVGAFEVIFSADPGSQVEDPAGPRVAGGVFSGPAGIRRLSEKPLQTDRIVNEWLRFREPGTYRFYASAAVRDLENRGSQYTSVSNMVTLTIEPAPRQWVAEQIAAAERVLAKELAPNAEVPKERVEAIQTLSFLDSDEAEEELVRHLGDGRESEYRWIRFARDPARILAAMEAHLVAPDQAVWNPYLTTLRELEALRTPAVKSGKDYAAILARSVASKQPDARAISLATLLSVGTNVQPAPVWLPLVAPALIEDFLRVPVFTQRSLLEYSWDALKSAAMVPVLRKLYANPPAQATDPSIEDLALRRMLELAPDEARRLLLAEMIQPTSTRRLKWPTYAMLPDATLPDLEENFAELYERRSLDERLILRYATGKILDRVKPVYIRRAAEEDSRNGPFTRCGTPLVAYFLKYDPAFGEQELRRSVQACYGFGLRNYDLGAYAMSPALQRLAIEFLMHPSVPVKIEAAEMLGRFGDIEAREPLWGAMEYFHNYWGGREAELMMNQEGVRLEQTLRTALAKPRNWNVDQRDMERLLGLCSSAFCKGDVQGWMNSPSQSQR